MDCKYMGEMLAVCTSFQAGKEETSTGASPDSILSPDLIIVIRDAF